MQKISLLITSWLVLLGTLSANAAEGAKLVKISEHVYAYSGMTNASPASGFGANAGIVIGRDSVAVIDTLISAQSATRMLAQIREITTKPIRYLINTHAHLDHAWGNCVFAKQGAIVIGQNKTREELLAPENGLSRASVYGISEAQLEGTTLTPPTITFDRSLTVDLGAVSVELTHSGPSHTRGSTIVYIPSDKVLFTGDILVTGYHPYMNAGEMDSWLRVLADLKKIPATVIVPGHGPLSNSKDIDAMVTYMRVFDTEAKRLCAGKTAADAESIADEMARLLPAQGRTELPFMIKANLAPYLSK